MNKSEFEKWFSDKHGDYNLEEESGWYAKCGWEACKEKVLEVLSSHADNDGFSSSVLTEKVAQL